MSRSPRSFIFYQNWRRIPIIRRFDQLRRLRLDLSAQCLLRHRRPLWLKVYTLKDVVSELTLVGRTTGIRTTFALETAYFGD